MPLARSRPRAAAHSGNRGAERRNRRNSTPGPKTIKLTILAAGANSARARVDVENTHADDDLAAVYELKLPSVGTDSGEPAGQR
jgi:hypothetical protein